MAAEQAIIRAGDAVIDMAYFTARDSQPAAYCGQMVARADTYVGLIGIRYGSPVSDRPEMSHTELEFETATDLGLPRLIFMIRDTSRALPPIAQSPEDANRQDAFRRRLQVADLTIDWISLPAELELRLFQALGELKTAPESRVLPPEPRAGIPPDPIEHFAGREAELAELRRQLEGHRRVVLHGLGGVGKTQLALRYIDVHVNDYPDGCFWLRADQISSLVGDLASLAWRLELPERELPEQELQIEAVMRWLRGHGRWLLVLDNLDQPVQVEARRWLAPGLAGHVLITSRFRLGTTRVNLEPLPLETASEFLLQRTGQPDAVAARIIAQAVDGLPLALEQAAAYLVENDWRSLADYAALLQGRMRELLREGKPEDYPLPVASTWDLSFRRLEESQPVAADLLRLCAFLAPDDIPIGLLRGTDVALPDRLGDALKDEIAWDHALGALRGYSLVQQQEDGLRVHRLVQWVVRESLAADEQQHWLQAAIKLLNAVVPTDDQDPKQWPLFARLLPHALAVVELLRDQEPESEALARLLDRVACYLRARADYSMARPLFERSLAICERVLGPVHPDTARSLNDLARLLEDEGALAAARPLFERALAIREKMLGPDDPDTADAYYQLAALLWRQGELVVARSLHERALAIREKVLGPDHPTTARSLNSLGIVLRFQGDLAAARPLYERAIAITEKALGPEHLETARILNNLAWLLGEQGELAAARPLAERALAIVEKVLGPDHPDTARFLDNLAWLLQKQGELKAARPLYDRALAIIEKVLGPDHPDTATCLNDSAGLLKALGEIAEARLRYERALAIRDKALGPEHLDTADSLHNLAILLRDQGELKAARPLLERALAVREKALGPNHSDTARTRDALHALGSAAAR
jgi:tetratricopeptide (TPR) repeat protein